MTDRIHDHVAAGNYDAMRAAVEAGAHIDARDSKGRTALHRAVEERNVFGVNALLRCCADVDAEDHNGLTAEKLTRKLLRKILNGDPNASHVHASLCDPSLPEPYADYQKWSNLQLILRELRAEQAAQTVRAAEPGLEIADTRGWTAVHHAARRNDIDTLHMWIAAGANLSIRDLSGMAPVLTAAANGATQALQVLMKYDRQWMNRENNDGQNAVHLAVLSQDTATLKELEKAGADEAVLFAQLCDHVDAGGRTPIDLIVRYSRDEDQAIEMIRIFDGYNPTITQSHVKKAIVRKYTRLAERWAAIYAPDGEQAPAPAAPRAISHGHDTDHSERPARLDRAHAGRLPAIYVQDRAREYAQTAQIPPRAGVRRAQQDPDGRPDDRRARRNPYAARSGFHGFDP